MSWAFPRALTWPWGSRAICGHCAHIYHGNAAVGRVVVDVLGPHIQEKMTRRTEGFLDIEELHLHRAFTALHLMECGMQCEQVLPQPDGGPP